MTAAEIAAAASDSLTVLRSVNRRYATKQFTLLPKTGEIKNRSYGTETHFSVRSIPVASIIDLAHALAELTAERFDFVIRGAALPGVNLQHTRRLLHPDRKKGDQASFTAAVRHWFAIDLDHI